MSQINLINVLTLYFLKINFNSILSFTPRFSSGLFSSSSPTKILYAFLISYTCTTFPSISSFLISSLIIFGGEDTLRNSCIFFFGGLPSVFVITNKNVVHKETTCIVTLTTTGLNYRVFIMWINALNIYIVYWLLCNCCSRFSGHLCDIDCITYCFNIKYCH
jgi:hypothetical protein